MIDDSAVDLVQNAIMVALKVSAPILVAGVVIGLIISIFQSVTQIQEQTLSLVPKIFVMCLVAVILMPWIIMKLAEFCVDMFRLF
ncbi:MAG: flagellar biosynthetic protein FliQ [Phycisphaerales bacterium JB065]